MGKGEGVGNILFLNVLPRGGEGKAGAACERGEKGEEDK